MSTCTPSTRRSPHGGNLHVLFSLNNLNFFTQPENVRKLFICIQTGQTPPFLILERMSLLIEFV